MGDAEHDERCEGFHDAPVARSVTGVLHDDSPFVGNFG